MAVHFYPAGIKGGAHPCEQQFLGRRGKPVKKMRLIPAEKAFAFVRKLLGVEHPTAAARQGLLHFLDVPEQGRPADAGTGGAEMITRPQHPFPALAQQGAVADAQGLAGLRVEWEYAMERLGSPGAKCRRTKQRIAVARADYLRAGGISKRRLIGLLNGILNGTVFGNPSAAAGSAGVPAGNPLLFGRRDAELHRRKPRRYAAQTQGSFPYPTWEPASGFRLRGD